MFRGYRLFIAAVGLVLVAANPPTSDDQQDRAKVASANAERSLEDMASSLRETNKVSDIEQPCNEGVDQRSSDLCAQWKAADAAQDSANAAWLFGALGTVIGVLTLAAAVAAAYFAKKAADHTETGAEAARDAANETKRIGEAQVRCYIATEHARIVQTKDGRIFAYCTATNFGSSPAKNVRLEGALTVFGEHLDDGAILEMVRLDTGYFSYHVPVGVDVEMGPIEFKLLDESKAPVLEEPNTLVTLRTTVTVEDVFGSVDPINARFDTRAVNGFRAVRLLRMDRGSEVVLTQKAATDDGGNHS